MPSSLISLGANLGNVQEAMQAARRLLVDSFGQHNVRVSNIYRTPPVGGPSGQGDFLNAVAAIETDLSVWDVWESIKKIETTLGRQRQLRWEARRIDIDLLLYGDSRVWTPHLKVPHPRMCMRTFVIKPALDVAPNWVETITGWTISQLAEHLHSCQNEKAIIRVLAESKGHLAQLRDAFDTTEAPSTTIQWGIGDPRKESIDWIEDGQIERNQTFVALTIAAVRSPDPDTVLWEDFSSPWVRWMGLASSSTSPNIARTQWTGPRYLLPIDNLQWAVHEILSAREAMRCEIERLAL